MCIRDSIFQNVYPLHQLFKSMIIFLAIRIAEFQDPSIPASVYRSFLSGNASCTMRTLSKWSPTYQWNAVPQIYFDASGSCLLYTSDAADDLTRVDLGGR